MESRSIFGVIATILWILFFLFWISPLNVTLPRLQANEVGDMLAGVVAPIAFLWLILGYYQQGRELSNNTQALQHQVKEAEKQSAALREELEVIRKQSVTLKLSAFTQSYEIVYESLCRSSASMCRVVSNETAWKSSWERYGQGYTDVFANTLKNAFLSEGSEEIEKRLKNFFGNLKPAELYCDRFEETAEQADESDVSSVLRATLEFSGIGGLYWHLCQMLHRQAHFRHRGPSPGEKIESMTPSGMYKPVAGKPARSEYEL